MADEQAEQLGSLGTALLHAIFGAHPDGGAAVVAANRKALIRQRNRRAYLRRKDRKQGVSS